MWKKVVFFFSVHFLLFVSEIIYNILLTYYFLQIVFSAKIIISLVAREGFAPFGNTRCKQQNCVVIASVNWQLPCTELHFVAMLCLCVCVCERGVKGPGLLFL